MKKWTVPACRKCRSPVDLRNAVPYLPARSPLPLSACTDLGVSSKNAKGAPNESHLQLDNTTAQVWILAEPNRADLPRWCSAFVHPEAAVVDPAKALEPLTS